MFKMRYVDATVLNRYILGRYERKGTSDACASNAKTSSINVRSVTVP